jgi:hypothetical protein
MFEHFSDEYCLPEENNVIIDFSDSRKRFEQFMFGEEGSDLHSKINCGDISANAFARKVWLACEESIKNKIGQV